MRHTVLIAFTVICICFSQFTSAQSDPNLLPQLDFRRIVQDAKAKVFPAVVFIKSLRESHEAGEKISQEISGSGVLISPEGEVLTNWHVVEKTTSLRCLLYDGRAVEAEVIGTDKSTDLALIQLKLKPGDESVPFADFGDSTILKEGDFVMPWARLGDLIAPYPSASFLVLNAICLKSANTVCGSKPTLRLIQVTQADHWLIPKAKLLESIQEA